MVNNQFSTFARITIFGSCVSNLLIANLFLIADRNPPMSVHTYIAIVGSIVNLRLTSFVKKQSPQPIQWPCTCQSEDHY